MCDEGVCVCVDNTNPLETLFTPGLLGFSVEVCVSVSVCVRACVSEWWCVCE